MTLATARTAALIASLALTVSIGAQAPRATAPSGAWRIDPAVSLVQFTVTKFGFADVTGRFTDFSGTIRYDAANPRNSAVEWAVRVASVRTGEPGRDSSLQAAEYFDAQRYPELRYRSLAVLPGDGSSLQIEGELTMKGITRVQRLVATPVDGGFETSFTVDRFDFDIAGGTVMRRIVGRTVQVRLVAIARRDVNTR